MVSFGNKKKAYRSIKLAAKAAGVPYMTFYLRLRMGKTPAQATKIPVRKYIKAA